MRGAPLSFETFLNLAVAKWFLRTSWMMMSLLGMNLLWQHPMRRSVQMSDLRTVEGAGALAFQGFREETVPETPYHDSGSEAAGPREEQMVEPDAEADTERKRMPAASAETPESSPKGKKARTAATTPVPEVLENELLVEDAFMVGHQGC